jgi:hypothetical protein
MTELASYFTDFLDKIRLDAEERDACEKAHTTLRERLVGDPLWGPRTVGTFLQGSYRRHTGCRRLAEGDHLDVDVVFVTDLNPAEQASSPKFVVELLRPFLDRWYRDNWTVNDRSICIDVAGTPVTLDLVLTIAPSEASRELIKSVEPSWRTARPDLEKGFAPAGFRMEASGDRLPVLAADVVELVRSFKIAGWQENQLLIPDRALERWIPTHPIAQIEWTQEKNARTSGHYVNVVKAIKWWRKRHADPQYPKGYPLEHLVGVTCPDGIGSVAEGIATALEGIRDQFRAHAAAKTTPYLRDHGVEHDVLGRVDGEDFAGFWKLVETAARDARDALTATTIQDTAERWRTLLGPEFPEPPEGGGFKARATVSTVASGGRFGGGHRH